ncbi:MAG: hypothetical protein JWM15_3632, partial [Cryptosporangiaceae bacterium]|nr:hypothetical protein [Cryptosporangiaceae bacterium]
MRGGARPARAAVGGAARLSAVRL